VEDSAPSKVDTVSQSGRCFATQSADPLSDVESISMKFRIEYIFGL